MQATLFLLLLFASVSPATAAPPKLDIPKDAWEPIFFESINASSKKVNWPSLRSMDLGPDAIEVRVWSGFGLMGIQGKRIRRVGQKWTGYLLIDGSNEKKISYNREFPLGPEWEAEWEKIRNLGILTLPDSSTLPDEIGVLDGVAYVVEINDGAHYRTYRYSNPSLQKWPLK
jgi:hypothetical protein